LSAEEILRCDRERRNRRPEVVGVCAPLGLGHQEAWYVVVQLTLVQTRRGNAGQGIKEVVVGSLLVDLEVKLRQTETTTEQMTGGCRQLIDPAEALVVGPHRDDKLST